MKKLNALVTILVALTLSACADAAKKEKKEEAAMTPDQKALHSLGVLMSQNIASFALTPEEAEFVKRGLGDGITGKVKPADVQGDVPKLQELERTRVSAANDKLAAGGTAYLENASKEAGVTKTTSGMLIKHTQPGTGPSPTATDQVKVHYEGRLIDGKVFDSSKQRGEPATFPLNGVIPCWTEGVQAMKVGGKAQLVCPPDLAYGPSGSPPTIPPQSTLVFDVELLEIVKK
jgi:FKBP-type peptidyl-prolyl cis-trans isomerase FkpA